jgi:hypothetical protein
VNGDTGDSQSWSPYASVRNNPLRFVDPEGLAYRVVIDGYDPVWFLDDQDFERMVALPWLNPGISFENGVIKAGGKPVGSYQHFGDFDAMMGLAGDLAAFGLRREGTEMAEGLVATAFTFGAGLALRAGAEAVSAARAVSVVFKTGAKVEVALASARIDSSLAKRAVEHFIQSRVQTLPAIGTRIEGFVEIEGRVMKITAGVSSTGKVVVGGIRVVR